MNKNRTLWNNIDRLNRCLKEIELLNNPSIFYCADNKLQLKCDKANLKRLKSTMKSIDRLLVVIKKQSTENINRMDGERYRFKYFQFK